MVPGVPCIDRRNWGRERDIVLYRVLGLREGRNLRSRKKNNAFYVYVTDTYKDVHRFLNGSVHEVYYLKACQICKVHARLVLTRKHETKNYYWLKINYETCTSDVEINKTPGKQNYQDERKNL